MHNVALRGLDESKTMSDDAVRLIVVDDVEDAAATLALLLELDGYQVRTANDGAQALAMIDGFEPHCILFDIDMPGIDGLELSRRVRRVSRRWKKRQCRSVQSIIGATERCQGLSV